MNVLFTDNTVAPVTLVAWSPGFVTALAKRGPYSRVVFIGHDGQLHRDPWLRSVERREVA